MNGINKEILGAIVTVVVAVGTKIVEEVSKNEEKKEEKKNANETEPLSPDGVASGRADAVFVAGCVGRLCRQRRGRDSHGDRERGAVGIVCGRRDQGGAVHEPGKEEVQQGIRCSGSRLPRGLEREGGPL